MTAAAQFLWHQTVPPEWQTDLDRLAPGENVSRLVLHWLAGLSDTPVQRWAIWEVLPAKQITAIIEQEEKQAGIKGSLTAALWKALKGPDPRTLGHWDIKDGKKSWRTKSLVSREQWDIHQATGGMPLLCWIIEGHRGGHAWQFGLFEQNFLLAVGVDPQSVQDLNAAWPTPGSQPYAPYDQRVFQALAERDYLARWRESLQWDERHNRTQAGLILEGETAHRREDMMGRILGWLDNQISDVVSDIPRKLLPQWSEFAQAESAPNEDDIHLKVVRDLKDYPISRRT